MLNCDIFVKTNIAFTDHREALAHIGESMVKAGVVESTYPQALLNREAEFPTGIQLEEHAVAIPHCEASHARSPAIYLIRPNAPVEFFQADDEGTVSASLIVALIVTHPSEQLSLLRQLFSQLQKPEFLEKLLTAPENQLASLFEQQVFLPAEEKISPVYI
jgi:PTS system galactitol-specific IIA component